MASVQRGLLGSSASSGSFYPKVTPTNISPDSYVDLSTGNPYNVSSTADPRIEYFKSKGIGKYVYLPGSVTSYRVPKNDYSTMPSRKQFEEMMAKERREMLEKQAANRAIQKEIQAERNKKAMELNITSVKFTEDPMTKIDIDIPINLSDLAEKATQIAALNKASKIFTGSTYDRYFIFGEGKSPNGKVTIHYKNHGKVKSLNVREGYTPKQEIVLKESPPTIDEIVETAKDAFLETEAKKIYGRPINFKEKLAIRYPRIKNIDKKFQHHIFMKSPKIEIVLEKLRQGLFFGLPASKAKTVEKEKNLLQFPGLENINFSTTTMINESKKEATLNNNDPFKGLGGKSKNKTRKSRKSNKTRKLNRR